MSFTCGIRISCARGRCMYTACGNPEHKEYRGVDPFDAMEAHRADAHGITDRLNRSTETNEENV